MQSSHKQERGFVLIGAVWLLMLATALVSILMLQARTDTTAARSESEILQAKLDRDAAVQTIAAELMIHGARSSWARLPAEGLVAVGTHSVWVRLTSEAGRVDLNAAAPETIDALLRGGGYSHRERTSFLDALSQLRTRGEIESMTDAEALMVMLNKGNSAACPSDWFTIASAEAQPSQAFGAVASMLQLRPSEGEAKLGEALRLSVGSRGGYQIVVRVMPYSRTPASILEIGSPGC